MRAQIDQDAMAALTRQLDAHPVYQAVASIEDLQCFMEMHVYSVWDFMSLLKYLQSVIAPSRVPWMPGRDGDLARFINELVLEEESDESARPGTYASHFDLYLEAMREIGADTTRVTGFLDQVRDRGLAAALKRADIPEASRQFTLRTFEFIDGNQPHEAAAAFALGREHIVPVMFRSILEHCGVSEQQAPTFHYYLKRHIHLDDGFHGPLSIKLLNQLCDGDEARVREATEAARAAIEARINLWDGVLTAIERRGNRQRAA